MQIPKIRLIPQPETEEAKKVVGYEWNEVAGTRHFLGGQPEGLPETECPKCNHCEKTMTFYEQIDSIGDEYDLADCIAIHNYVCFVCFTIKCSLVQSKA